MEFELIPQVPDTLYLKIREDFNQLCENNIPASIMLSVLYGWTRYKAKRLEYIRSENEQLRTVGQQEIMEDLWVKRKHDEFCKDTMFILKKNKVKDGLQYLEDNGLIESRQGSGTNSFDRTKEYRLNVDLIKSKIGVSSKLTESSNLNFRRTENELSNGANMNARSSEYERSKGAKMDDVILKESLNNSLNKQEGQPNFYDWFKTYDLNQDQMKCEVEWKHMTIEQRCQCIKHTRDYIKVTPKKYRKNPWHYLRGKGYMNEIIDRRDHTATEEEERTDVLVKEKQETILKRRTK